MLRLYMRSASLQTVIHDRLQAHNMAFLTIFDALLHIG